MGNRYVDEHLNVDTLSGLGEIYSTSTGNVNPKIETVGVPIGDNKTLSLKLGIGGTFPVLDESVPKTQTGVDYLSFLAYSHEDVNDPPYELPPVDRYVHLVDKYMKQRQSFMIDVNSYNSQGMVMMSGAETIIARRDLQAENAPETGVKRILHAPADFSSISTGLSTFQVAKLSREKTILSFDENNRLSMALDHGVINPSFTGSIEYEITDNNKTFEDALSYKSVIITGYSTDLKFYHLPEGDIVDYVTSSGFESIVEIMSSESVAPIDIDGKLLLHGENFILNKTSKCIRVTLNNGEMYSLNPYAVMPVGGTSVGTVVVFKEVFIKPSSVGYFGERINLYSMSDMHLTSVDGRFVSRAEKVVTSIESSSMVIEDGGCIGDEYFGQYRIDLSIDDVSFHQFGDGAGAIYAIRAEGKYLYIDGVDVFIKDESDVNFTKVVLPTEKNGEGTRSATVAGVEFSSDYDTLTGSVTKNSSFMYEMNYTISGSSVESEIIGDVYPVDFYRIEFLKSSCLPLEYPMETGHTTSKNMYEAGEVSHIFSKDDGAISVSNAKETADNVVRYSYLSAFGKWSDEPFIVESFGYVSRDTMFQSQDEHFLSVKLGALTESRSNRTYCGDINRIDPDYIVSWVKVRSTNQDESILFCENEYKDEEQRHLGLSSYLDAYNACDEATPIMSKLTYIGNPFEYTTGMSSLGVDSITIGDIEMRAFSTQDRIDEYTTSHTASPDMKSGNKIDGFGLNIVSVQRKTRAALTVDSSLPETISLESELHVNSFLVTIPEIGFIYNSAEDRYFDMQVIEKTQIKEQFKRGVKYQFDGFYITGVLKWDTVDSVMVAEYSLVDEIDDTYNHDYSMFFPDSVDQEFATEGEGEEDYDPYDIVAIYARERKLDSLRMIPMYLVNLLYSEFGFAQNILGVWDESSGVLIDDSTVAMTEVATESGFKTVVTCNAVEPMFFMDHYVTLSAYIFGVPYRIGKNIRLSIIRKNLLSKFSTSKMAEAEVLYVNDDAEGASRVTMDGYIMNFDSSNDNDDVYIEFSPSVFYPQGPWQNPRAYANHEDMMMREKTYSMELMPKSRIITSICVTAGNIVRFSHPAKRFSEVYSTVDGFVNREALSDIKEDSMQRGENTYVMEYIHHVGGGVNLTRGIYGDLLLYPARHSYPINNLIRELISPIREDAHAKAMDARAVFTRFDTRYVSNTIPSYYDKFLEFPTAFTCDLLPEEGVLVRDFGKTESLYSDNLMYIHGDDIVGDNGVAKVSFSNDTDQPVVVTITYDNHRWGDGLTSFNINDAYLLQREGWLLYEPRVNKRLGRVKSGVYLDGTTV